ncbi:TPR Domain containing protein [Capsaspora owczarzaki ATCC 30864]|uniref:TPR Domain containing protein n=1 Tax=Capsaspora owczarzaki (strain ATCC 30864) TaxID=595528 RepID=A0A0D2X2M5_CAPO3|nr:TPR Domain containing protein [Capsaspora owczarzaki ATCC 30864]KJE92819.1 TPR Domain containing protein [Capsaspora owczarzaki ATCC 30864]|eukprot:XP_004363446.1 TPR Domain containing protein [Capsaspora owczarzaki ATCC 30864]
MSDDEGETFYDAQPEHQAESLPTTTTTTTPTTTVSVSSDAAPTATEEMTTATTSTITPASAAASSSNGSSTTRGDGNDLESAAQSSSPSTGAPATEPVQPAMQDGGHAETEQAAASLTADSVENAENVENVETEAEIPPIARELTDDDRARLKELRQSGNAHFGAGRYNEAITDYTEALDIAASAGDVEAAIFFSNRAACYSKLNNHALVVEDCDDALRINPEYGKALTRRAVANEALEHLDEALRDYEALLKLDPNDAAAKRAVKRLPDQIRERNEKLKDEMLGKLKSLGNMVLGKFGLSTDNFQMVQDPTSGSYSINFKQ